jgi:crotonobetainyl-CoA:carnitine CoA-transferase CaiB-like acyl-CoA transferase
MAAGLDEAVWQDIDYRREHLDHIISVLENWTGSHRTDELAELGQAMRFPWAGIAGLDDLLDSPQSRERDYFTQVELPGTNRRGEFPGPLSRLSRSPWSVGNRAPQSGEDNESIYTGELKISAAEVADLKKRGII